MSGKRYSRTSTAKAWQYLYSTAAWKQTRKAQLTKQPLCERCLKNGKIVQATVCHHIEPHKGNAGKFYHGELASSCKPCHDAIEQSIERLGYDKAIDESGWPVDENHPVNRSIRGTGG